MKKYFLCTVLIFIFIGIMQVSALAEPPIYNDFTEGLKINPARAAQYTTANIGSFLPGNSAWTNISGAGFGASEYIDINIPHDAEWINFLYWDFGTYNHVSPPNNGWLFGGTTHFRVRGGNVFASSPYIGNYFQYTPQHYGRTIKAVGRYFTVHANSFRRDGNDRVQIELIRWVNVRGQLRTVNNTIEYRINWTGGSLPPAPPPTGFTYNDMTQLFSGISSAMEYSIYTTSWSTWTAGNGNPINLASHLSTSRPTDIAIRYRNPVSQPIGLRVPALTPSPTHLSLIWENGSIFLRGFKAGHTYAYSRNTSFSTGHSGEVDITNAAQRINVSLFINPGDSLYVREVQTNNDNAYYSDYIRLIAPAGQVPNAFYDAPYHDLVFPTTGQYYLRLNSDSENHWGTINITIPGTYLNMYPYLSTESETTIDVAAPWSGPAFNRIIIPPLTPAPDMWFEWVSDTGLVLWGHEIGSVYTYANDSDFEDIWHMFIAGAPQFTLGGAAPGNTMFARVAKDAASAPGDFIRLTVPPYPHNIETSVVGLQFNNGSFSYSAVRINDHFRINNVRQLYVVIKKYDENGDEIASSMHTVNINNNGVNLQQSSLNAAVRTFTDDEYLEITVYRNSTMQDELSSQTIYPTVFEFE
jgi:hypothetical protein